MKLSEKFKKMRTWPDKKKRIFLWIVGLILILIFFFFWLIISSYQLQQFKKLEINWPKLELPSEYYEEINEIKKQVDFSQILPEDLSTETLEELEKELEKYEAE